MNLGPQNQDSEYLTRQEMLDETNRGAYGGGTPDLLITNYSMLEYMLLRPIEQPLFDDTRIWLEENPEEYEQNQMIASVSENMYLQESEKLAIAIESAVKKKLPKTRMRGIKQAGFYVLVGAAMPKVLIEAGFITNKSEAKLLNKSSYRSEMAYGIFKGVQAYILSHNSQALSN